jgi:hypothetical protein
VLKAAFPFFKFFFVAIFVTVTIPVGGGLMRHYPREASAAQVPGKIVMRVSLQQKSRETGMENIAAARIHDQPPRTTASGTLK